MRDWSEVKIKRNEQIKAKKQNLQYLASLRKKEIDEYKTKRDYFLLNKKEILTAKVIN